MKLMFIGADHEVTGSATMWKPATKGLLLTMEWNKG